VTGKLDTTLAERGGRYGDFRFNAEISQALKDVCHRSDNWNKMPPFMREALDLMFTKVSRMLSGDWTYVDNPHDIIGYAKLMEDLLAQDAANPEVVRPRIVDLNYLDVQSIFDYLLEVDVGPEAFIDFCKEHNIVPPRFPLEPESAYEDMAPKAGTIPVSKPTFDPDRFDRITEGRIEGPWWVFQNAESPFVYDIADISSANLRTGVNSGELQIYNCPQDLTHLPQLQELGMVRMRSDGLVTNHFNSIMARKVWAVQQDDCA
jgi:hypothetical protein